MTFLLDISPTRKGLGVDTGGGGGTCFIKNKKHIFSIVIDLFTELLLIQNMKGNTYVRKYSVAIGTSEKPGNYYSTKSDTQCKLNSIFGCTTQRDARLSVLRCWAPIPRCFGLFWSISILLFINNAWRWARDNNRQVNVTMFVDRWE